MAEKDMDALLEEGKNHLNDLKNSLEKLAETAKQMAVAKSGEIRQMADAAESKIQETVQSDEFRNLESEGKKIVDQAGEKLAEAAREVSESLTQLFNKSKKD